MWGRKNREYISVLHANNEDEISNSEELEALIEVMEEFLGREPILRSESSDPELWIKNLGSHWEVWICRETYESLESWKVNQLSLNL